MRFKCALSLSYLRGESGDLYTPVEQVHERTGYPTRPISKTTRMISSKALNPTLAPQIINRLRENNRPIDGLRTLIRTLMHYLLLGNLELCSIVNAY